MTSNFEFLKDKDKKLFNIAENSEKLYRDGYFEQSVVEVRKFAEIVSKNILGVRRTTEETFDDILATLNDILGNNPKDRELIDDLYFIKKQGNFAAHEGIKENAGNIALECLKRTFEVSINYAIKNNFANKKILNSHFNIDILMTGKKYKFSEKYQEVKEEIDQEGIDEIAKRAKAPEIESKVIEADFKNKKVKSKKEKAQKTKTKSKSKKNTPDENKNKSISFNKDTLLYSIVFGILFVFFIGIMLFILPF